MRARRRKVGAKKYETQEALKRHCYTIHRSRAGRAGRRFNLTREEFNLLVAMPCHYCEAPPSNELKRAAYRDAVFYYQGLDRKDNARGYTRENVVPCCGRCNWLKGPNITYTEMRLLSGELKRMRLPLATLLQQGLPEWGRELLARLVSTLQQRAKTAR